MVTTLTRPLRGAPLPAARHRWQRFRRDLAGCVNWWAWIPGILGPTAISAGLLLASALQTEQLKNQLLVRFAQERLNQASQSLIAETRDYAIWDETHQFLEGSNRDYINKTLLLILSFVRRSSLYSTIRGIGRRFSLRSHPTPDRAFADRIQA